MKQLKIFMVAAILIGIVVAISYFNESDPNLGVDMDVDIERMDGDALLKLIDTEFCDKATSWNSRKYEKIRISMNAMAKNAIINEDQRKAFQTRMEQCSCETLNRLLKGHFSQEAYSGAYVDSLESSLKYMENIASKDLRLKEALQLIADYRSLRRFLSQSFQPKAIYRSGYNRYDYRDAWLETRDSWYQKDVYKNYFSKNAGLVQDMEGLEQKVRNGHYRFLEALEQAIERFHLEEEKKVNLNVKQFNDRLIEDQNWYSKELDKYLGDTKSLGKKLNTFVQVHMKKTRVSELEEYFNN